MIGRHGKKPISRLQSNVAYRRIAVIYNPFAGGLQGSKASRLMDAQSVLGKYGAHVQSIATDSPRSAGRLAAQAIASGADLIVAAGGDGTINETADGVAGSGVPLGILPAGTANVLACELRLSRNFAQAADAILAGSPERISMGRLHTRDHDPRSFLLMAGAGLDAHIVYSLNYSLKRRIGKVAYWIAGFSQFGRKFPEFTARIDGRDYASTFALISKVRNYGGDLEIARQVTLLDDEFEVVLFHGRESWRYVKYLAAVAARQLKNVSGVTVVRTREIQLTGPADPRVYLQVDGEFAGHLPARIEIIPDALDLVIPQQYLALHCKSTAAISV